MPKLYLLLASASALAFFPQPAAAQATPGTASKDKTPIETIVVTASPITGNPDRFATIVERVPRIQILESGGANIADALAKLPGVDATSFSAGSSRPVIRGFQSYRVLVMENGINSFDVSDIGPDHGVPIDPLAAQDIEVVRGAATLRYGSQAIGGVVNIINNRVPTSLPEEPFSGTATVGYDTNADGDDGSLLMDGRIGNLALHADGFIRRAEDYETPYGEQDNSLFRGDSYSAGGSYFFDPKDRIGAAIIHYDAKYGIPSDTTYIDMRQTKGLFGSSFALDTGPLQTLSVDAGYASYSHDEDEPDGSVDSTFLDEEWESRAELVIGKSGPLSASAIGIEAQHRDFSALGDDGDYLFPTHTRSLAAYAFAEAKAGKSVHFQFAARIEDTTAKGTPASNAPTNREFVPVSGSAGVLFDVASDLKLGLTLSSAGRAPEQAELFARGPHDGPDTFETGDPTLKIERANSAEGTLRFEPGDLEIEASLWGALFENYIYGDITGNLCTDDGDCSNLPGADLKQLFYRQADADFWGAEGKAGIPLAAVGKGSLKGDLQADFVRATLADGLGNVPRLPPYRFGTGLSWDSKPVTASFMLYYDGRQDETAAEETATKSFYSLDANIAWRPFSSRKVELAISGKNLTDTVQRDAVSINKDEIVLPGRDVRFVVRVPL